MIGVYRYWEWKINYAVTVHKPVGVVISIFVLHEVVNILQPDNVLPFS